MERSRSLSQAMQFGALGIFGLVAAATIATQVGHVLAAPTARLTQALSH